MLPNLFFISLPFLSLIFTHSCYSQCLHHQKSLLLQLKKELTFNSSVSKKLVQWNQRDEYCCKWHGVECDTAGNITSLQLDHESISGGIGDSSTLFKLTYLQKLNLAYNELLDTPIPRGIQNLIYLTHLNLSNAVFSGQVPAGLSSLRRLVSLDISNVYWELDGSFEPLKLEYPNLTTVLRNLTGLRHLYLDGIEMPSDEKGKWSHIISSYLPHLVSLSLRYCSLSGPLGRPFSQQLRSLSVLRLDENDLSTTTDLDLFANFSSLTTLSLIFCGLNGSFPATMFQIPTLQNLDLSGNELLVGSLPPFNQNGSLKSLVVSETNLSGSIPSSISNLKNLQHLDMSYCQFTGSIPSTFANLTGLVRVDLSHNFFTGSLPSTLFGGFTNLVYLNLEYNSIYGSIPHSLFGLSSLLELHLSMNRFDGRVEEFPIVNVSSIVTLDLSSNRIEGRVPNSFFQLHSLESLKLSENFFDGNFQLNKIRTLPNLTFLYLSDNLLSVDVGSDNSSTIELPKLKVLSLTSCNMLEFPTFIKHSDLNRLDLSSNRIAGEIPSWIWGTKLESLNLSHNLLTDVQKPYHIPPSLFFLDLQSNQLRGELVTPLHLGNQTSRLGYLLLANNSFSGSIPPSLCIATNLEVLDLSVNELRGTIPSCLLDDTLSPRLINLGWNSISGSVPDSFSPDCNLEYLDLNNNTLEGKIPKSLKSCKGLEFLNVGNNIIDDTFPCTLPSSLRVLGLNSNRFNGEVRCHKSLPNLQILDISSNNFSGSLESMNFSSWRGMVLRTRDAKLEHNKLGYNFTVVPKVGVRITMKGLEVELVKIFPDFTAIDFSSNNFRGKIPNAIGDLSSLRLLNFSHNAINGSIPKSIGKLRNLESLDLSRNLLTGPIPVELAGLTFLSVLNLSDNKLVGKIPKGSQFQTFSADSFERNSGLCGFPLNISCSNSSDNNLSPPEKENVNSKGEIEWEYVCVALGYAVGIGSFAWLLLFYRRFRVKYFGKIDEVVEEMFDARDRRRRTLARRRAIKNREVRH